MKTGYGNWIRFTPPRPKTEEALPAEAVDCRSSSRARPPATAGCALSPLTVTGRGETTRKLEVAHLQLKRKVKALEAKCAELQAQQDTGAGAAKLDGRVVLAVVQKSREEQHRVEATAVQREAAQKAASVVAGLTSEWAAREAQLQRQVQSAVNRANRAEKETEQAERDWEYCAKKMQDAHDKLYELKKKTMNCGLCCRYAIN